MFIATSNACIRSLAYTALDDGLLRGLTRYTPCERSPLLALRMVMPEALAISRTCCIDNDILFLRFRSVNSWPESSVG
jgi:hypothetical protein